MNPRFGVDYTSAIPPSVLKAHGVTFVARYLAPDGHSFAWKKITAEEASVLKGAGIDIVLVWETSAKRALDGRNAGVSDAAQATVQAKQLGLSLCPIYFAVDFDVPDFAPNSPDARAKLGQIGDYFDGANGMIGVARTGVYGGYWAVKRVLDAGLATYAWQTLAWSGGQWDSRAQLRQYSNGHTIGGHSVDYDTALASDFGQWRPPVKPKPVPVPPPKPVPPPVTPPHVPAGPVGSSPFWTWVAWRDGGAIPAQRPPTSPARVPLGWYLRYYLHKGQQGPLPKPLLAYLRKRLGSP